LNPIQAHYQAVLRPDNQRAQDEGDETVFQHKRAL